MKSVAVKIPHFKASKRAKVDDDVYEQVRQVKWYLKDTGYASAVCYDVRGKRCGMVSMHTVIMQTQPGGQMIDHINGDKLDNRRENLRLCTNSENMRNVRKLKKNNTSGFVGVSLAKDKKKWHARITTSDGYRSLGVYPTKEAAHEAYKTASLKYHGEFSPYS